MNNSVANPLRCLCHPQAYLPLSYAAQIPTTRNPDLANVRLSLSNLDQEVRKCSVGISASVCYVRASVCVTKVCSVFLYLCVLMCMCDGGNGEGMMISGACTRE